MTKTGTHELKLRLPAELHAEIAAGAAGSRRSINAEIILRLGGVPTVEARVRPAALDLLRDQFAMQVLRGIIDDCGLSYEEMADRCYHAADAMLARRNREAM